MLSLTTMHTLHSLSPIQATLSCSSENCQDSEKCSDKNIVFARRRAIAGGSTLVLGSLLDFHIPSSKAPIFNSAIAQQLLQDEFQREEDRTVNLFQVSYSLAKLNCCLFFLTFEPLQDLVTARLYVSFSVNLYYMERRYRPCNLDFVNRITFRCFLNLRLRWVLQARF